jgi:3-methyladenine DNA glycosylase AlkD
MIVQTIDNMKQTLAQYAHVEKKVILERFFKTQPGGYAQGDIFIGVTAPNVQAVAKIFQSADHATITQLIQSEIHEERMLALQIWLIQNRKIEKVKSKENEAFQAFCRALKVFYDLYLQSIHHINNWDLIDVSAPLLVGRYLYESQQLNALSHFISHESVWHRRIVILSSFYFIKQGHFDTTLNYAQALLKDRHDLIHKAVGWMLREIGKKDVMVLKEFLGQFKDEMPRTMLRYAIERLDENDRKFYMKKS